MFIVPEKINESALKRRGFKPFFVLITPVATLTNFTGLSLEGNEIKDITPVATLTNLTWLGWREMK